MSEENLVEQKLDLLDARLKKVERFMMWNTISNIIKVLIVLVPIILALIYIPPFVKKNLPFFAQTVESARRANFLIEQISQTTKSAP